jgi:hypothetical protein
VAQLAACTLELPLNVRLGRVEPDVRPCEPEHFATAQAEHENQSIGGVERVVVASSGRGQSITRPWLMRRVVLLRPAPGSRQVTVKCRQKASSWCGVL